MWDLPILYNQSNYHLLGIARSSPPRAYNVLKLSDLDFYQIRGLSVIDNGPVRNDRFHCHKDNN